MQKIKPDGNTIEGIRDLLMEIDIKSIRTQIAEQWRMANIEKVKEQKETIYGKFCEGFIIDDYGNHDASDWWQGDDYEDKSIDQIKLNAFERNHGFS